jgi:hypothetical protein
MFDVGKLKKLLCAEVVTNALHTLNRCPTRALCYATSKETWSRRRPCVTHMRMFENIAYTMVQDEKKCKLDVEGIKFKFLGYCEGMKTHMLKCLGKKNHLKFRDVVFMEDNMNLKNDLEMRPSGRNEGLLVVVVDTSSKLPLFDGGGQSMDDNEQVGGNGGDIKRAT